MAGGKMSGSDVGLLVLRLALGGIIITHGVAKLYPDPAAGFQGFADYLLKLGVPSPKPMAGLVLAAEILGGLLVVTGIFARLGALGIAGVMAVGMIMVHWQNGFFIPQKVAQPGDVPVGIEFTLALLAMALCVAFAGAGGLKVPLGKRGGGP